jgi:hypothetical protein
MTRDASAHRRPKFVEAPPWHKHGATTTIIATTTTAPKAPLPKCPFASHARSRSRLSLTRKTTRIMSRWAAPRAKRPPPRPKQSPTTCICAAGVTSTGTPTLPLLPCVHALTDEPGTASSKPTRSPNAPRAARTLPRRPRLAHSRSFAR